MDILIFSLLSSILPLLIFVIEPIMRFSVILVAFSVTVLLLWQLMWRTIASLLNFGE